MPRLIETNPIEIGVYGSYARGESKATSDIDVYVLYTSMPHKVKKGELYEEAEELGIDLFFCEYEAFYNTQSVFCDNLMRDRVVLWKGALVNENKE